MIEATFLAEAEMSDHDIRALEANFDAWKKDRAPDLPDDTAFEMYAADQILKDFDLSDEDINSGSLGGGDDGGVDSAYLFMDGILIQDETIPPSPCSKVELILVQATRETGFKEERIEKFNQFARDMFTYTKEPDEISYLNSSARDAIRRFREKHTAVLRHDPRLLISFHYACKSTTEPRSRDKVIIRSNNLRTYIRSQFSDAVFSLNFWTSLKLLEAARKIPKSEVIVPISKHFSTDDGSTVFLVNIRSYASEVLTAENGDLNTRILAANVRDYNGTGNPVNTQIRDSLTEARAQEDFWWLNNGVTILASSCSINGNKATIRNPEIVNGLQTSHEIFGVRNLLQSDDPRQILVRVVIPKDEGSRDKIIKATNSQTPVKPLSLLANERIQFDIEDRLKRYGLFYDRKHGEYKRLRKPLSSIVGQNELVYIIMAMVLRVPDQARGRPLTYFADHSAEVFNSEYDRDVYAACVLIDRQVMAVLNKEMTADLRKNLRFYVSMLVCCALCGSPNPTVDQIAALTKIAVKPIDPEIIRHAIQVANGAYKQCGEDDKAAKGSKMREVVLANVHGLITEPARPATRV